MSDRAKIEIAPFNDHLETLRRCGGFYRCPKNSSGERLGPLVGYAGTYTDIGETKKQYVGDVYANFAKAEEHPEVLQYFADCITKNALPEIDFFCGAPIGGYSFADKMAAVTSRQVIKAEKKVVALATATSREQSKLVFGRHSIESGARYAIVEDVCNNFTTTLELINLICGSGGTVAAIICLLNRSLQVGSQYQYLAPPDAIVHSIPVIGLVRLMIDEYTQDDPLVAEDIKKRNVVWKPKDHWKVLMERMEHPGV